MTRVIALAIAMCLGSACATGTSQGTSQPSPTQTQSPLATRGPITTPATDVFVKCEDFPQQTYTDSTFGFSVGCPRNYSWESYARPSAALFAARVVDNKYLVGVPPGWIWISVYSNDVGALRDWITAHTGAPSASGPLHFWGSTSNLSDTQVAGRPAVGFDTTSMGGGPPPTGRAVALLLPDRNVFVIHWTAYQGEYAATLDAVARQVIATIQV